MEFNTALLHQQFDSDTQNGATIPPIYQVSAFAQSSAEQLEKVFNNKAAGFAYTRISNPTVDAFERRVASMEKGIGAVACSSGMAAVTMALLNILEAGDEVIAGSGLFGGTIDLFGDLKAFGITTHLVESVTAEAVAPLLNEKTKVVFTELIGNPKLDVVDLKKVSSLVHEHGVPLIIDSTTATPYLLHTFDFGADVIVSISTVAVIPLAVSSLTVGTSTGIQNGITALQNIKNMASLLIWQNCGTVSGETSAAV